MTVAPHLEWPGESTWKWDLNWFLLGNVWLEAKSVLDLSAQKLLSTRDLYGMSMDVVSEGASLSQHLWLTSNLLCSSLLWLCYYFKIGIVNKTYQSIPKWRCIHLLLKWVTKFLINCYIKKEISFFPVKNPHPIQSHLPIIIAKMCTVTWLHFPNSPHKEQSSFVYSFLLPLPYFFSLKLHIAITYSAYW